MCVDAWSSVFIAIGNGLMASFLVFILFLLFFSACAVDLDWASNVWRSIGRTIGYGLFLVYLSSFLSIVLFIAVFLCSGGKALANLVCGA